MPEFPDFVGLAGIALVAGGMYLVWQPGAALVPGALLIGLAVLSHVSRVRASNAQKGE